jgi:hypothetical protein
MSMTATTPMASVMTVRCGCPGDPDEQQIDLEAVGITLHCASCGGVIIAGFKSLPEAIGFLQHLASASGYSAV